MSLVFECQECKAQHSALTEAGICINCDSVRREAKMKETNIKMAILQNDGNVEVIAKLTGETPKRILEIKKEMKFKKIEGSLYSCTRCGKPTEILLARMGHSGVCEECAGRLEKKKEYSDRYKEPVATFASNDETPRFNPDEDLKKRKRKIRKG